MCQLEPSETRLTDSYCVFMINVKSPSTVSEPEPSMVTKLEVLSIFLIFNLPAVWVEASGSVNVIEFNEQSAKMYSFERSSVSEAAVIVVILEPPEGGLSVTYCSIAITSAAILSQSSELGSTFEFKSIRFLLKVRPSQTVFGKKGSL